MLINYSLLNLKKTTTTTTNSIQTVSSLLNDINYLNLSINQYLDLQAGNYYRIYFNDTSCISDSIYNNNNESKTCIFKLNTNNIKYRYLFNFNIDLFQNNQLYSYASLCSINDDDNDDIREYLNNLITPFKFVTVSHTTSSTTTTTTTTITTTSKSIVTKDISTTLKTTTTTTIALANYDELKFDYNNLKPKIIEKPDIVDCVIVDNSQIQLKIQHNYSINSLNNLYYNIEYRLLEATWLQSKNISSKLTSNFIQVCLIK